MSKRSQGKWYHGRIDVRGMLRNGRLTDRERFELRQHLAAGREIIPAGTCDNWDAETQECMGHKPSRKKGQTEETQRNALTD